MDMARRQKISLWASRIWGLIVMLNLALTLLQPYLGYDLKSFVTDNRIQVIAYGVFFVLLLWSNIELHGRIEELEKRRPNLTVVKPIIKILPVTEFHHKEDAEQDLFGGTAVMKSSYLPPLRQAGSTDNYEEDSDKYTYGAVIYENRKIDGKDIVTALTVHGKIFFFDENLNPLKNVKDGIEARWAETTEPTYSFLMPREKSYYLEIDIPAGAERELCVVLKHKNDDNCYIFNYETYAQNKLKRPEASLGKGSLFVKIVLRGSNTISDTINWFKLNNPGSGFDFAFDLIDESQKGKIKRPSGKLSNK